MDETAAGASWQREGGAERRYRRKLLALVSSAGFFEGYDSYVLAFVTAVILRDLSVPVRHGGLVKGIVEAGAVAAFFLATQVDRFGRRRLLLITITGYTICTFLTAFSPGVAFLTLMQLVSRTFSGAEGAIATTMVVEEYPAAERGRAVGILACMGTLATITVGLLGQAGLGKTSLGWRAYYLVGIVPLILVALARRGIRETSLYSHVRSVAADEGLNQRNLLEPWRSRYRGTLLAVGFMHFFRNIATASAVSWFAYYAEEEVGLSEGTTGLYLAIGAGVGVFGFIVGGRLMDRIGRRPAFMLYTSLSALFGVLLFQNHDPTIVVLALCGSIFFGLGSGSMTNAFATEPFPTYVRGRGRHMVPELLRDSRRHRGADHGGFLGRPAHRCAEQRGERADVVVRADGDPGAVHRVAVRPRDEGTRPCGGGRHDRSGGRPSRNPPRRAGRIRTADLLTPSQAR